MATETKKGKRAKSTSSESLLNDIRRNTKRIFSSEQKVLIVMEGIRGELSVAELCLKYGISDTTYYKRLLRNVPLKVSCIFLGVFCVFERLGGLEYYPPIPIPEGNIPQGWGFYGDRCTAFCLFSARNVVYIPDY